MDLYQHIQAVLTAESAFCNKGKLLKNTVVEAALKLDERLLQLLIADKIAEKQFFKKVAGVLVFDKIKFQKFVANKQFLPDSYTAFKNKIGLTVADKYWIENKNVVLSWAYKDTVLEGGQTKEDQQRKETFWNSTLAADAIDRLFEPKTLVNWQRYDRTGASFPTNFSLTDNLILKGNNLIALHSLKAVYQGKVKLIYIDPPYNTGSDGFHYNDSFNHSAWLTFMKNRLEIAKTLLTEDGSIWLNIDDREGHYLKVLCDEIFGREQFLINFIWQKKYSPANDAKFFSDNHDHILVFAKNKNQFKSNLLPRTAEMNRRYKNPDNDPRGDWKSGGFSVKSYSKDYDYPIETPSGKIVLPPLGGCWQTSKENYLKKVADNRIWFGKNGDTKPQLKQFLSEVQQGIVAKSIWLHEEVGHNQVARREMIGYFGAFRFATPKPEQLLKRVIELGSNEGDLVLDFFAGSGTTCAVAMKMKRQFIGIEQMDYIETVTVERLKKIVAGAQVGISKAVNWQGGSGFVYAELCSLNEQLMKTIILAETRAELLAVAQRIFNTQFIDFQINETVKNNFFANFNGQAIADIKNVLAEILDANMWYLPFSESKDADYEISKQDLVMSAKFYELKK